MNAILCGIVLLTLLTIFTGYQQIRKWITKQIVLQNCKFSASNQITKKDSIYSFDITNNSWNDIIDDIIYPDVVSIINTIRENPEEFFLDQIDHILICIRNMDVVRIKLDPNKLRNMSLSVSINGRDSILSPIKFMLLY